MTDDHFLPGGNGDEQALRSLLHGAVEGLEPSEGALERLRYAVPVRRTRRRRALLGAAVGVLLAGAAVPTALHLHPTGAEGGPGEHSAMAGHEEPGRVVAGSGSDPHQNGAGATPKAGRSTGAGPSAGGPGDRPDPGPGGSPSGGAAASPSPGASDGPGTAVLPAVPAPGVPGCSGEQLGVQGSAGAPEPDGTVYGRFKVTNVSTRGCAVLGPDTVTAASVTASAPGHGSGVTVVGHTAGDPAARLPDPAAETPQLLLQPYTAYEVRFAWVPSAQPCPAATASPGGEPPAGGSPEGTAKAAEDPAGRSTAPQTGSTGTEPTGVAVSHTPGAALPGAPVTQTTIPAACGGTVYRTGLIPLEGPKPTP